nr:peptidylprolyl isomerase [Treponema socranskii]
MCIAKNRMVKIHYTLKDSDGTLIDSSSGLAPFEYLHGNGNLIPGLEAELEGKNPGDTFTVTVLPKDGYGEYDPKLHIEVPRDQFDNGSPLEVGMKFQAQTAGGPMTVTIQNITDKTVTVDGNHELAGKTLVFDVTVVDVREATDEELMPELSGCGGSCGSCGGGCGGCGGGCGSHDY